MQLYQISPVCVFYTNTKFNNKDIINNAKPIIMNIILRT